MPSGDSTEVPNPPSQRARIRFLLKSSALEFSDHCTPMPSVGVHDDRVGGQDVTHSSGLRDGGTTGTPNSRQRPDMCCREDDTAQSG